MTKAKEQKILSFAILIAGITCIIFAIIYYTTPPCFYLGAFEYFETYGGDAYTGIQNAAAQTANNIIHLNQSIESATKIFTLFAAGIFVIIGFLLLVLGTVKLIAAFSTNNPQQNLNDIPQ